jgi:hypothetical protein
VAVVEDAEISKRFYLFERYVVNHSPNKTKIPPLKRGVFVILENYFLFSARLKSYFL